VNEKKRALVTGITGQDGSYLAELLLSKGYEVHGLIRRSSFTNDGRLAELFDGSPGPGNLILHNGDMTDGFSLQRLVAQIRPDEIYNLAAMSDVHVSFDTPEYTADVNGLGTLRILEAVRNSGLSKVTRVYHASTSELYGNPTEFPQNEETPFAPQSPYGVAKLFAYWITKNYRETYGMYAVNGILFNHESPRRGQNFVTRKITSGVCQIAKGSKQKLALGNLSAKRDWGDARDYVAAMWKMLQLSNPDDFVIATGVSTEVREFASRAFQWFGVRLDYVGVGKDEKGVITDIDMKIFEEKTGYANPTIKTGQVVVEVDPKFFRPLDVNILRGDSRKAERMLEWDSGKGLDALIEDMMQSDWDGQKAD
jgi:GDPmannose 4,6-dehydratase